MDFAQTFHFWEYFANERLEQSGVTLLANRGTPLLLSNAAWLLEPDEVSAADLQQIATWYAVRDITPALVVPAVRKDVLSEHLEASAFSFERAFSFLELSEPQNETALTEQVSWAQGRALGEYLAAHHGFPKYGVALGAAITAAMQQNPQIVSFAAYASDEVTGALVAQEHASTLSAMMMAGDVETRLNQEALSRRVKAFILEVLPEGVTVEDERSFERWSVR